MERGLWRVGVGGGLWEARGWKGVCGGLGLERVCGRVGVGGGLWEVGVGGGSVEGLGLERVFGSVGVGRSLWEGWSWREAIPIKRTGRIYLYSNLLHDPFLTLIPGDV